MTRDDLNSNYDIIYDHRNLILELKKLVIDINGSRNDTTIYHTLYYYDEAGNRIRKMIYNNYNDSLLSDNIYSRDVSGRELAIYKNGSIDQWNIYGMDNIGFIDGNEDIRFYMKDHLGSIRAVTDVSGNVVSSQDGACPRMLLAGDAWGYLLENRVYESDVSVYKFTSKERDDESKYDYFGARYYDARVANWTSIDPLMEKHYDFSPYNYVLRNPLIFYDPDGKQVFLGGESYQESIAKGQYIDVNESQLKSDLRFDLKRSRQSGFTSTDVGLLDPVDWFSGGVVTFGMRLSATMGMSVSEKLVQQTLKGINKTVIMKSASTESNWVLGTFKSQAKWASQFSKRGWTSDLITEAISKGKSYDAANLVNKLNSATRYVHPKTGQSVVIDNVTKEILHIGGTRI